VIRTVGWVCEHWQEPDEGIWEVHNGRRLFTHSRPMCWVALDRAIRIAARRGLPAPLARWTTQRDAIYLWIRDPAGASGAGRSCNLRTPTCSTLRCC
jgi:GH15 family glucan-1,4-alpha-glucosidase